MRTSPQNFTHLRTYLNKWGKGEHGGREGNRGEGWVAYREQGGRGEQGGGQEVHIGGEGGVAYREQGGREQGGGGVAYREQGGGTGGEWGGCI